jgi:tryptophan synthase alpha chain
MSRISQLFKKKNKDVLNVYCTAGFPNLNNTVEIMNALVDAGVDMIELGIPYSDPLADGAVIQASSAKALSNGMTIEILFQQLKNIRSEDSKLKDVPVVFMGYLNPILQYGFERFCKQTAETGIDGLIIPDIPMFEFEKEYGFIIKKYNLDFIFLVTPETSEERIKKLDSLSSGFLYGVSSSSLTGSDKDFSAVEDYLKRLNSYGLKNPVLVGFGIKDRSTFTAATKYSNGAIIGSAYIQALENAEDINEATAAFIKTIRE